MVSWLFVDRLLHIVTVKELSEVFTSYGTIKRVLMFKNSTGNRVAFIEMTVQGNASKAAQSVNESRLLGNGSRAVLIHRRCQRVQQGPDASSALRFNRPELRLH